MTLELPAEVRWLEWVVGSDWPDGDEDALWRLSAGWRDAARDIYTVIAEGDTACARALESVDGPIAAAMAAHWAKFGATSEGYLVQLATLCEQLADHCDQTATQIEYAKYQFIAALIALAIEIAYLVAMAVPTSGASAAAIPLAEVATQSIIRTIAMGVLRTIGLMVVQNVVIDVVLQDLQINSGHRAEFDSSKTVQTAVDGVVTGAVFGALGGAVHVGAPKVMPESSPAWLRTIGEGVAVDLTGSVGLAAVTGEDLSFANVAATVATSAAMAGGTTLSQGAHGHGSQPAVIDSSLTAPDTLTTPANSPPVAPHVDVSAAPSGAPSTHPDPPAPRTAAPGPSTHPPGTLSVKVGDTTLTVRPAVPPWLAGHGPMQTIPADGWMVSEEHFHAALRGDATPVTTTPDPGVMSFTRPDIPHPDTTRPDTSQPPDTTRTGGPSAGPPDVTQLSSTAPSIAESPRPDPVAGEANRPDSGHVDATRVDPQRSEPQRADPARTDVAGRPDVIRIRSARYPYPDDHEAAPQRPTVRAPAAQTPPTPRTEPRTEPHVSEAVPTVPAPRPATQIPGLRVEAANLSRLANDITLDEAARSRAKAEAFALAERHSLLGVDPDPRNWANSDGKHPELEAMAAEHASLTPADRVRVDRLHARTELDATGTTPADRVRDGDDLATLLSQGITPAEIAKLSDPPTLQRLFGDLTSEQAENLATLLRDPSVRDMLHDSWGSPPTDPPILAEALLSKLGQRPVLVDVMLRLPELREVLTWRPTTLDHLANYPKAIDAVRRVVDDIEARGAAADGRQPDVDAADNDGRRPDADVADGGQPDSGAPTTAPQLSAEHRAISDAATPSIIVEFQDGFDSARQDDPAYRAEYLEQLYDAAYGQTRSRPFDPSSAQGELDAVAAEIAGDAGKVGGRHSAKNWQRVLDKVERWDNEANRLTDLAGVKIIFSRLDDLYASLDQVRQHPGIEIVALEDRFAAPTGSGYRDVQMNVRASNGHIGEFRLHLASFDEIAEWEHSIFEVRRDLDALEGSRGLTATEAALRDGLKEEQKRVFQPAFEAAVAEVPRSEGA